MPGRRIDKIERLDPKFVNDMRSVTRVRIMKGLANPMKREEISMREMTELLTRTNSYKKALEELRTKPKGGSIV